MRERLAPALADHVRTEHDISERAREPVRQLVAAVDRKGEDVGGLVDAEMIALERAHLVGSDEREPQLPVRDPLGAQDACGELDRRCLVDLDREQARQRLRSVPVSSAWCLYASTIRCTSWCLTTSWWPKRMNAMPSI